MAEVSADNAYSRIRYRTRTVYEGAGFRKTKEEESTSRRLS